MILKVKDENGQFKEVVLKGLKGDKGDRGEDGTVLQQKEIDDIKSSLDNMESEKATKTEIEDIKQNIADVNKLIEKINNNGSLSFSQLGGIKDDMTVDNAEKLLEAMNYCSENGKVLIIDGKYRIATSITYKGWFSLMVVGSSPNHNSLLHTSNDFKTEVTNLYFTDGATLEINKMGSVTFFGVGFSSTSKEDGTGIILKSFANKFINCKFNQFYRAISCLSGASNWLGENQVLYCNFYNSEFCYYAEDGSDSEFIGNLIHGSCGSGFYGSCAGYTIALNHFYGKKPNEFEHFNTLITDNYIQESSDLTPSIILKGSFGCQLVNNKFELNSGTERAGKKSLVEIKTWIGGGNIMVHGNNVHGKDLTTVKNLCFLNLTSRDNNGVKDMPITLGLNGFRGCESVLQTNYPMYNFKGNVTYPINTLNVLGGTLEEHKAEVVNGICYFWLKFSSLPKYADIIKMPNYNDIDYTVHCRLTANGGGTVDKTIMTNKGKIQLSDYSNYTAGEFTGSYPITHSSEVKFV